MVPIVHPQSRLAFIIGCRKNDDTLDSHIVLLQHEPLESSGSTKRMTSDGIIKDEPDFVETHCHWLGCDRDLHTQEQLVKVTDPSGVYNHHHPTFSPFL